MLRGIEEGGCGGIHLTPHDLLNVSPEEECTENVDEQVAAIRHVSPLDVAMCDPLYKPERNERQLRYYEPLELGADEVNEAKHEQPDDEIGLHVFGGELSIEAL